MQINNPIPALRLQDVNGNLVRCKVLQIGGWDMDATLSVNVSHGLDLDHIINVTCWIIADTGDLIANLMQYGSGVNTGQVLIYPTLIYLERKGGGIFDSPSYDNDLINRGWVFVWYTE